MRFSVLALLAASPASAAELTEYGNGVEARESHDLHATCEASIELKGAIAVGETRFRIANTGTKALAAAEDFSLPRGAVVTGFQLDKEAAVSVNAGFSSQRADDVIGADPAVLIATGDDRYRATVQPIAPGKDAMLVAHWSLLPEIREGGLRFAMPAGACKVSVKGAKRVSPAAQFDVADKDVKVIGWIDFAGKTQPMVWTQTESLGDGWTAEIATVIAPPHHADGTGAHRVLFVVDTSRSMDLVGRSALTRVVDAVGATLPEGSQVEAILYDRKAARAIGAWTAVSAQALAKIDAAITARPALNGSDIVGAFQLAHDAIADGARTSTMVVAITDGVFADLGDSALPQALGGTTSSVDFHAIVLDPGPTRSPGAGLLGRPVALYGGSLVEVPAGELDSALGSVESWLRPAWMDVRLDGGPQIPAQLPAGGGASYAFVTDSAKKLTLISKELHVAESPAVRTPIAALALASAGVDAFVPNEEQRERGEKARAKARRLHPAADDAHAFAVLNASGKVATDRRAMVKGGGPYSRIVALADQARAVDPPIQKAAPVASAIARDTLDRLFRDQLQPKAYVCYQKALGITPTLAGSVYFEIRLGRGEITDVQLSGMGDAKMHDCLLDAAYAMTPPLPDWEINADDVTVARYPLTFNLRADHPIIVPGDADSESPLDIDAIQGGVPERRKPIKVETNSPLGKMRPPKS